MSTSLVRSLCLLLLPALTAWCGPTKAPFPADHRQMTSTVSYGDMKTFLEGVVRPGLISLSEEGRSTQGRKLFLVRLHRGGAKARFKVLFYAQQHGNEVAGKDALLTLVRDIAERPERLPDDVDLYLMPMLNPDGAEAHVRLNGAGADLNRDHLLLSQPETQALHRVARRIRPHLAVDGHEFGRDGEAYAIEPSAAARFIPILEAQGLRWETLREPRRASVERVQLTRMEEPYDELYQRYENRQIVERCPPTELDLPAGTLIVPLDQELARRAIQVLEPCLLYGIYSHPGFRDLARPGVDLPVSRLF